MKVTIAISLILIATIIGALFIYLPGGTARTSGPTPTPTVTSGPSIYMPRIATAMPKFSTMPPPASLPTEEAYSEVQPTSVRAAPTNTRVVPVVVYPYPAHVDPATSTPMAYP